MFWTVPCPKCAASQHIWDALLPPRFNQWVVQLFMTSSCLFVETGLLAAIRSQLPTDEEPGSQVLMTASSPFLQMKMLHTACQLTGCLITTGEWRTNWTGKCWESLHLFHSPSPQKMAVKILQSSIVRSYFGVFLKLFFVFLSNLEGYTRSVDKYSKYALYPIL